ncbi:hypothetical protein CXG81DRAFT_19492 [Caulochytrium protostelioides]|uniref:Uncharacterized protein n=1 Tax=Caulochytrium protostelioides TaxID=1555241 RepID=A0A4P9X602_9FUNG|nr:hypothetical protein CXG81DRAFT_19492 [Caulochytrium protostelioides]|eukprot:RKP00578.1 hypothetical protein CXG81DRAFT_19492 [Caulochytrium protostelioides]
MCSWLMSTHEERSVSAGLLRSAFGVSGCLGPSLRGGWGGPKASQSCPGGFEYGGFWAYPAPQQSSGATRTGQRAGGMQAMQGTAQASAVLRSRPSECVRSLQGPVLAQLRATLRPVVTTIESQLNFGRIDFESPRRPPGHLLSAAAASAELCPDAAAATFCHDLAC